MQPYEFPFERFGGRERLERIRAAAVGQPTPCLYIDLDLVEAQYRRMRTALPYADVYYAVKANPMREVLELLVGLGSSFDIASRYELDLVLSLGVDPNRISFGNTIKKRVDIAYAFERGVRLFACDAEEDVKNLAEYAPGSRVFFRVFTQGTGSDWPLSRKFGAHPDMIFDMARMAADLGLEPYGISFHVGSQQRDIGEWDDALARTKQLFDELATNGIELGMINLGGGFPADYLDPTHPIEVYAQEITRYIQDRFGDNVPRVIAEPGRYLVADSGTLVSEVVLVSKKARNNLYRWVY
ncbi:MAG TPA: type III PLP-dependent enzyme, partial [Spirochaetia bacterium]|nr:type III PLP-dependent enzyme [Spirochaetia bacterium]